MRSVVLPVGTLRMIVCSEEGTKSLRRVQHVVVGLPRPVPALVELARAWQGGQLRIEGIVALRWRESGSAPGVAWKGGRSRKRRAHHNDRAEDIRSDERAPCRGGRASIVADHTGNLFASEGGSQSQGIGDDVQEAEGMRAPVVGWVPTGRPTVTPLVSGDDVKSGLRQRQHDLAPTVGEFREAVQKHHERPVGRLEPGLQHVNGQAIDSR